MANSKRILVTGAAGFIGSHLVELLVEEGFEVRAFVRYNSKNSWGWLDVSDKSGDIEVVSGDIRDFDSVYKAMRRCDAVFHLAALIGIPYSYESPLAYIRTNVEGTYNVLEAGKSLGVGSILVTSTSETYGSAQYVPIDENHPLVGQSPYSATKIAADQLAISYHRSFGLGIKVVRPFNTYGPRQSARAVIPTIISQLLCGRRSIRLGNVTPTRDLTFVKDTARGFLEIFRSESLWGEVTNIGMDKEISVLELGRLIGKLMDVDIQVSAEEQRMRPDASEVNRLRCNNSKLIEKTHWQPRYDLVDGLRETIEWMKANSERYKPDLYTI